MAMGRHRLIAAQLASGALVEALPNAALEAPRIGWWFVTPRGALGEAAQRFHAWLAQAATERGDTH
jgi:LysR family glycine cleavage system transcriptional activator